MLLPHHRFIVAWLLKRIFKLVDSDLHVIYHRRQVSKTFVAIQTRNDLPAFFYERRVGVTGKARDYKSSFHLDIDLNKACAFLNNEAASEIL